MSHSYRQDQKDNVLADKNGPDVVSSVGIPQKAIAASSYTIVEDDNGKDLQLAVTVSTIVIPAQSVLPLPIGFVCGLINLNASTTITIQLATDTLTFIPSLATDSSRDLAPGCQAYIKKLTPTTWLIGGNSALT